VGTTNARKNLLRMLEAFALVAKAQSDLDLVVVGAADVDEPAIREAVDRLGVGDRVHRLGYVSDQELAGIVAAAQLLVFPSLYEGFGMPVVEAMSAGVPVAASANPSLDEACGNAAARFDPLDVEAMAARISSVLGDASAADDLVTHGRAHAARFTWSAAGEAIAQAIEETVA
jgi:glycosyltransferase involved in cell wall biosynthesis